MRPIATWFPMPAPGRADASDRLELSAEDFRVAFKAAFQRQVMQSLFVEIQAKTGDATVKDVIRRICDPGHEAAALRTWYARARGERIPRPETLRVLLSSVPGIKLDIHHPMLTWLAAPDLDPRSIRRLKTRMPAEWKSALDALRAMPTDLLEASPRLVKLVGLDRLGYLDALMLFAADRFISRTTHERRAALNRILWLLPLLYPDDPLWQGCETGEHRDRLRWLFALIDHSLGLLGPDSPSHTWSGQDRSVLLFVQHWRLNQHRLSHPQACRTQQARRRYWARDWKFR